MPFAADRTPVEHIDAQGQSTTYRYDSNKRLIAQQDPLGRVTKYQYDDHSNRTLVIDPLQRVTRMTDDGKWNTVNSATRYNAPTLLGQANPQVRSQQDTSSFEVEIV